MTTALVADGGGPDEEAVTFVLNIHGQDELLRIVFPAVGVQQSGCGEAVTTMQLGTRSPGEQKRVWACV